MRTDKRQKILFLLGLLVILSMGIAKAQPSIERQVSKL